MRRRIINNYDKDTKDNSDNIERYHISHSPEWYNTELTRCLPFRFDFLICSNTNGRNRCYYTDFWTESICNARYWNRRFVWSRNYPSLDIDHMVPCCSIRKRWPNVGGLNFTCFVGCSNNYSVIIWACCGFCIECR